MQANLGKTDLLCPVSSESYHSQLAQSWHMLAVDDMRVVVQYLGNLRLGKAIVGNAELSVMIAL